MRLKKKLIKKKKKNTHKLGKPSKIYDSEHVNEIT